MMDVGGIMELTNCPNCGEVFAKNVVDVCPKCYRMEEEAFQKVYKFLQKQKNRSAALPEIAKETEVRSEEHTSELQSRFDLVCRLRLEKKKNEHNHRLDKRGNHVALVDWYPEDRDPDDSGAAVVDTSMVEERRECGCDGEDVGRALYRR